MRTVKIGVGSQAIVNLSMTEGAEYQLRVCAVDANGNLGKSVTSGMFIAQ